MDQESEGTSLVIFVVGGVVLLLLILGAGTFFFLMRSEARMEEAAPFVDEPARVEVHEEGGPVLVGPGPVDEPIRPKVAPIKKPSDKLETLPGIPKEKNQQPPLPQK
jgi:hypothetical protein